jgi:hypothetical protein
LIRLFIIYKEKPMSLYRKLIVHALLALLLFAGVSSAAAAPATDHQVISETVTFTIPADQCPLLPAGVSVSGTGERQMIINTRTKSDGTTEVRTNDLIKGVATDSNGGVHKFVYHNASTETILMSGLHEIGMNDSFVLSGPGPHYSVTFNWRWTFTPPEPFWPPAHDLETLNGDPDLVFACDPL